MSLSAVCAAASSGAAPSVYDDDKSPAPSPQTQPEEAIDESDFMAVYQRARRRMAAGDHQGALDDYRHAYKLSGGKVDWIILANYGQAAMHNESYVEAITILTMSRKRLPPTDELYSEISTKLGAKIRKARLHVGELLIDAQPAGATVLVDDKKVGVAPLVDSVFVEPGAHTITVTQIGLGTESTSIDIEKGQLREFTVIVTGVEPGAWRLPAGVTVGAFGLAGLATGIGLLVASSGAADDILRYQQQVDGVPNLEGPCGTGATVVDGCQQLESAVDQELTFRTLGIAGMVTGGVLLATSATILLWPNSEEDEGGDDAEAEPEVTLRLSPWANPTTMGIILEGVF